MKLKDVKITPPAPKYQRPTCATCGRPVYGKGYFCSFQCDEAERYSRLAHRLVEGLRDAAGRPS